MLQTELVAVGGGEVQDDHLRVAQAATPARRSGGGVVRPSRPCACRRKRSWSSWIGGFARLRNAAGTARRRRRRRRRWRSRGGRQRPQRAAFATSGVSDYLLWSLDRGARSELLHMMGLVAAVVAIVILVFFGLGLPVRQALPITPAPANTAQTSPSCPLALFGITNDGLNLAVNLLILFLVVLWLALIAWTFFDARRRIDDPVLVACATAASLFPFVGHDRLLDPAPAGVPGRQARARARDPRLGAARAPARGGLVPELRAPGRAHLPALPKLPGAHQGPVRVVRQADRPALDDLPVLRDAAAPRRRRRSAAPSTPRQAAPTSLRRPRRAVDASRALSATKTNPRAGHERSHQQPVELVRVRARTRRRRGRADPESSRQASSSRSSRSGSRSSSSSRSGSPSSSKRGE